MITVIIIVTVIVINMTSIPLNLYEYRQHNGYEILIHILK